MTPRLQRATLLIDQNRYELAERELSAAMADDPNDGFTHACMAICLLARQQYDQATELAERAVHLNPEMPMGHAVLAMIWQKRNYLDKAEAAIREAIALAPHEADFQAQLGNIKYHQDDWEAARQAAEAALMLNPEHIEALNLRAEALRKLGRTQDARAELQNALRLNPDSADSHAVLGWNYLQQGDRKNATKHFREALRLNPESEWARQGVLETLRSYNPVYRPLLKFFLFIQTLGRRGQWGVILGAYIVYRVLLAVADANPAWKPYIMPLVIAYIVFAIGTWIGRPLMNLALRLHPLGRLALSRDERIASNWIGGFLVGGLAALAIGIFVHPLLISVAVVLILMVIPLAAMFGLREPRARRAVMVYTLLVGACGTVFVAVSAVSLFMTEKQFENSAVASLGEMGFWGLVLGALVSPLAGNILASISWKR
jgi:tetratricopeptide (TPR) repeat protein